MGRVVFDSPGKFDRQQILPGGTILNAQRDVGQEHTAQHHIGGEAVVAFGIPKPAASIWSPAGVR